MTVTSYYPGGHYWDFYRGALSLSQVSATYKNKAPAKEIYGHLIFTWVAETLTHWPLGNLNQILDQILVIDGWGIFCEIALIWMSIDFTDHQSTLIQVMAWCRQAASHYLSQCWPRSMSPNGVTRPQWVNIWQGTMVVVAPAMTANNMPH